MYCFAHRRFRFSDFLKRTLPKNPDGFLPKPALYISLLLASVALISFIPSAANTSAFMAVTRIAGLLPYSFLILPYVVPTSWGIIPTHPHESRSTYLTLFRTMTFLSAFLHARSTLLALFTDTPQSTHYRHSLLHPFKDQEEHRSFVDRSYIAMSRVFGAIGEHPAVGSVGWDVLLTGLSIGLWAAIRGLDVQQILDMNVPLTWDAGRGLKNIFVGNQGNSNDEAKASTIPKP